MSNNQVIIRQTELSDLETLYLFQLDKEANFLAAFTSKESANRESYIKKYTPYYQHADYFTEWYYCRQPCKV
jgi:ribosomal-protein-alanine N-acetyltransferase